MITIRSSLLAAAAISAVSGQAFAQSTPTTVYGGGASLPAPYVRQAADCYGSKVDLAFRGQPAPVTIADFLFTGSPTFNCAVSQVNNNATVSYISTGSGRGILGFFAKTAGAPVDWLGNPAVTGGTQPVGGYATKVNYALSETALAAARIAPGTGVYDAGGSITEGSVTVTVRDPANTNGGTFPNPRNSYGRAIQVPILVAAVTVAYDDVYAKIGTAGAPFEYAMRYANRRADGSGGLRISRVALCRMFNGEFANLNEIPAFNSANPTFGQPGFTSAILAATQAVGNPVGAPAAPAINNVPLIKVGRSDGSGTTSIWTRHLAVICPGQTYSGSFTNQYANSTSTLPANLQGPLYNKALANDPVAGELTTRYTRADGNDGVAKYIDFTRVPANGQTLTQARFGYVGTDFVLPFVLNTQANNFNLQTATLFNQDGNAVAPTAIGILRAFQGTPAPDTDANGDYDPTAAGDRSDPSAGANGWVQLSDITSPLADPDPANSTGQYPIVGTTNILTYQCFAVANEATVMRGFLNWYFGNATVNDSTRGILALAGFQPVPTDFRTAILDSFVFDTQALNLDIRAITAPECAGISPGA